LRVATGKWGDVVAVFGGAAQPNFADITAIVDKFKTLASAADTPRTDLVGPGPTGTPNVPEQTTDFRDISADVDAFKGVLFPYATGRCP